MHNCHCECGRRCEWGNLKIACREPGGYAGQKAKAAGLFSVLLVSAFLLLGTDNLPRYECVGQAPSAAGHWHRGSR